MVSYRIKIWQFDWIANSWAIANQVPPRCCLIGIQTKAEILRYTSREKKKLTYFGSCPHTVTGVNVVNDDYKKKHIILTQALKSDLKVHESI